jgi:hypothetical protein
MSEDNISANDFNEMRKQKAEKARKQREFTAKIERLKLEEEKSKSSEKYEQLHQNIKQIAKLENLKKKPITAADLLMVSEEALMDYYDTRNNFIERCLIIVEIKKRSGFSPENDNNLSTTVNDPEIPLNQLTVNTLITKYDINTAVPAIKKNIRLELMRRMKEGK